MPDRRRLVLVMAMVSVAFLSHQGSLKSLVPAIGAAEPSPDNAWFSIKVPGAWETNGPPAARAYDGFAWYRTWLKPHDSFFSAHERNLFAESVTLSIRGLADAHEVFINGVRLGGGGSFPPDFASGRGGNHRHKVPPGVLRKGEWNEVAIRVYNQTGPGGFLGEAPFIMNYFMECVLEGTWEFRLGDSETWKGQALASRPATSAFDEFRESNRVLGEAEQFVPGRKLPPEESLRQLQASPEFAVEQLLAEPHVAQPTHLSFDERGRLWVAQYRQYPYPAGLQMLSRDKYYRSHYDKVPPPPPHHDRGRDVVSVHEDTDGDGWFDRHKIFQDGLNMANAALRGRGGVWVMHTPYLLFYPDPNFDDVPDGPPVVHLAGFGLEDTHSVANGLVWGMDGWLYGGQGSTTSSRVVRPGLDPKDAPGVYFEGCMVWRYHPKTRAYEIFAEGSGNTFGLEIDAEGRLFSGHNGGDTRGWHYLQGGIFLKQGRDPGKFGPPRYPYAFGDLPMMQSSNSVQRFSHLFAMGEGTALPREFAGKLFAIDPVHSSVLACERLAIGATFKTSDIGTVLTSRDEGFRPVFIVNAPDGSLLIADFYEQYIAHGQHYQSQIDPTTGRIYRLRGRESALERDFNLADKNSSELVSLLWHPNKWHRQMAVRLLGERQDRAVIPELKRLATQGTGWAALGALWSLHQMDALEPGDLLAALRHAHGPMRWWAVRIAGDKWGANPGLGSPGQGFTASETGLPPKLFEACLHQTSIERDAEVRSQIASTARRLPAGQGVELALALLRHDEDVHDPYLPLLCWWALEHHLNSNRGLVLALFKEAQLWDRPLVFEHILARLMRRLAAAGGQEDLIQCAQLLRLAPDQRHAERLLQGFEEAYRGRALIGLPEALQSALAESGQAPLTLRVRQGDSRSVTEALEKAANPKTKVEERVLYTRAFGELRLTNSVPVLLALAVHDSDSEVRKAAFAALAAFEDQAIAIRVLELVSSLPADLRLAALNLLAARPAWTRLLLEELDSKKLNAGLVPPEVADRLRLHSDSRIGALALRLFPGPAGPPEPSQRLAAVETALQSGSGNPYAGETIFSERCAACHKLFHKGGNVGPDLTAYQRDNLGTMLASILNPNAEIREGFETWEVETADGRILTGFVTDRSAQTLTLRGLDGQDTVLRQSELTSSRATGRSLMPEGLLDDLTDQQLRDFFAFLKSSQPFTR